MNNIRYLELDFYRTSYKCVKAHQYDKNTRYIVVTCVNDAKPYPLDQSWYCNLKLETPDGRKFLETETIQYDGTVLIELKESMLLSAGVCKAELNIYDFENGSLLSTMPFNLIVIGSVYDNSVIESSNEFSALNEVLFSMKDISDQATAATELANETIDRIEELESNVTSVEISRVEAESARVSAENVRIENENNRKTNEMNRENAEREREVSSATALSNAEIALQKANEAVVICENASNEHAVSASNSASNASVSASTASLKATEASNSAIEAASSAANAKISETSASESATDASISATTASEHATNASNSASSAKTYANTASSHATTAITKASEASTSANEASVKANEASVSALLAESYMHGGTGLRDNENVDNAKYYKEQAEQISQGLSGALLPKGTITFSQLASQDKKTGFMYNISDSFTTDNTFKEGSGYTYPEGTNVYCTADGYWDCIAGTSVVGVKGSAESSYRKGNVNITKNDIGLGNVDNTADNKKSVLSASKLSSAVKIGNADFNGTSDITLEDMGAAEQSVMGKTDISRIYGGTVTDAIYNMYDDINDLMEVDYFTIGNTDISDIGDGTLTGAVSSLNDSVNNERVTRENEFNDLNKLAQQNKSSVDELDANKLDKTGDSTDNTVTFSSGDSTSPTGWDDIVTVASGETHKSLFRKFSLAVKNLRYLYKMLGSTDISAIGDGTATGAIATINEYLGKRQLPTYTNPSQFGLSNSGSNNTVLEIVKALPVNSMLVSMVFSSNTILNQSLPSSGYGILTIKKPHKDVADIEFADSQRQKKWKTEWDVRKEALSWGQFALNSDLKWSLAGSAFGNGADNSVALPEKYNELLLICESANAGCYTFNILKEVLYDSLKSFRNGYYSSSNMYGTITINVSASQAYIGSYSTNGVAATSIKLTVHYK